MHLRINLLKKIHLYAKIILPNHIFPKFIIYLKCNAFNRKKIMKQYATSENVHNLISKLFTQINKKSQKHINKSNIFESILYCKRSVRVCFVNWSNIDSGICVPAVVSENRHNWTIIQRWPGNYTKANNRRVVEHNSWFVEILKNRKSREKRWKKPGKCLHVW